jgi:hypothetical protein
VKKIATVNDHRDDPAIPRHPSRASRDCAHRFSASRASASKAD